tara:strand:+ start:257 stop:367 length:111 start_codon:yes stop_codon:yes gene_type:complete
VPLLVVVEAVVEVKMEAVVKVKVEAVVKVAKLKEGI